MYKTYIHMESSAKDSRITRQESTQKMWGHALVYMKIEKGAKGR